MRIEDLPGDDEADEDVPDETSEAHGDVGHGEGPEYVIIHPAQTEGISGDITQRRAMRYDSRLL